MKKAIVICMFLIGLSTYALAETKQILSDKNEYHGKTIEFTYSPGDQYYKTFKRHVIYYDNNGKERKGEIEWTKEATAMLGVSKWIDYFDNKGELEKKEVFLADDTKQHLNAPSGASKCITHFAGNKDTGIMKCFDRNGKYLETK